MYIKVYIFGMELSQGIHFLYQIFTKKWSVFEKMAKITFLLKKNSWTACKTQF